MILASAYGDYLPEQVKPLLDGGVLKVYSVARPRNPDEPVTRSGLLATFRFATPAFVAAAGTAVGEPDGGTLSGAALVENPVNPEGVGTPGFARAYAADGVTPIADFIVGHAGGPQGGEVMLSEISTTPGYPVRLTALRL